MSRTLMITGGKGGHWRQGVSKSKASEAESHGGVGAQVLKVAAKAGNVTPVQRYLKVQMRVST